MASRVRDKVYRGWTWEILNQFAHELLMRAMRGVASRVASPRDRDEDEGLTDWRILSIFNAIYIAVQ